MALATSIIEIKPGNFIEVIEYLKSFPEIEYYGESEDHAKILVVTDIDIKELEGLVKKVTAHESIINMLQHSFYYDNNEK